MREATLTVAIQSYWHPGTGRGSGFYLDAVTHTGADGLPRLPGRTLKGLIRDALWRAESWGWEQVPKGSARTLFGAFSKKDQFADENHRSTPGQLRFSDALLDENVADYLANSAAGRALVPGLFREHFSTAIEHRTGVARNRSLRGMQVVVPLTLTATIGVVPGQTPEANWYERIDAVLPLVTAVGAYRSRGFGRAQLTLARSTSCAN